MLLTEYPFQYLTRGSTGQRINEGYRTGALETCQPGVTVLYNFFGGSGLAFLKYHNSHGLLPPLRIRYANYRRFRHIGMRVEHVFNFFR